MDACILELGTRVFHLFHARVDPRGGVEPLDSACERVALDASIEATGAIGQRSLTDSLKAVGRLVAVARRFTGQGRVVGVASHALASARNADVLVDAVHRRYGIPVRVLTAHQAAQLVYAAVKDELGLGARPVTVAHLGESNLDFAAGVGSVCTHFESLSLGTARIHRAYGASESGHLAGDASAIFSLIRLCAAPACSRLREMGDMDLVVCSEAALAVRDVARAWGYMDAGSSTLGRLALHALSPEILAARPATLHRLGLSPEQAGLAATTAVMIDALADLQERREVSFAASGVREGAALEVLAA